MNTNNSSRVLVNVVGAPAIIAVIYFGDAHFPFFSIFISLVMLLCASEINTLLKSTSVTLSLPLIYLSILLLQILRYNNYHEFIIPLLVILLIISMLIELMKSSGAHMQNIAILIFAFCWLGIGFGSAVDLRLLSSESVDYGRFIILTIFLSVWLCDSAAYIFGKRFGEKKIAASISPNKTWFGSVSGFLTVLLLIIIFYIYDIFGMKQICNSNIMHAFFLSVILGIGSQFGDLIESLFKRDAGVKDSGTILMGHGGVLDRFDSLLFVIPMMWIYVQYFLTHLNTR